MRTFDVRFAVAFQNPWAALKPYQNSNLHLMICGNLTFLRYKDSHVHCCPFVHMANISSRHAKNVFVKYMKKTVFAIKKENMYTTYFLDTGS
jgi:hypothetical protein